MDIKANPITREQLFARRIFANGIIYKERERYSFDISVFDAYKGFCKSKGINPIKFQQAFTDILTRSGFTPDMAYGIQEPELIDIENLEVE